MNTENLNNSITASNAFIKHAGIVTKLSKDSVIVTLTGNVNCTSCHAKSACGVSDSDSKIVEVFDNQNSFNLNENVAVIMKKDLGLKAVFMAYVFPFILLFLTLIISLNFFKEWQAGLLSLFILVPYYAILYYSKKILKNEFKITLLKLHKNE